MAGAVTYQYATPVPPFGAIDADEVGTFPLYEGLDPADLGAHEGMGLLIVATPFDATAETETPGPIPFGTAETGGFAFTVPGAFTTRYVAATHGVSTATDDEPANTYVPGKFSGEVQTTLSLFAGANPLEPGQSGFGELQIIDPDGELDDLIVLGWEGAALELRRGEPGTNFSTWATVARLTSAGLLPNLRTKSLRLRPLTWLLEQAELHGQRYGGTGGADGDATLAGRLKPYAVGYVFNITPVLINAAKLIAQVSRSSVASIGNVTDGHATALLNAGDHATYEALADATVPPDSFATCLALGLMRLGAAPVYGITCDVQGDADTIEGQPAPTTRGRIVRRIATGIGAVRLVDSEQIDFAAFQDFENKQSAAVGWYWDGGQPVSKAEAIAEVLAGCCGWWLVRPNGQLAIGQAEDPASYGPTLTLDYPAPDAGEVRLGEPAVTDTLPPRRATYIGWRRNYTVQTPDKLAGSVSQADAVLYGQPSLYAGGLDQFIANNYPTSPVVYLLGNYRDEADALVEAQRQMILFSVPRARYVVPIAMDPLADVVGQRAVIRNLDRLGWGASKALLACGINAAAGSVELHFWG